MAERGRGVFQAAQGEKTPAVTDPCKFGSGDVGKSGLDQVRCSLSMEEVQMRLGQLMSCKWNCWNMYMTVLHIFPTLPSLSYIIRASRWDAKLDDRQGVEAGGLEALSKPTGEAQKMLGGCGGGGHSRLDMIGASTMEKIK